MSRTKDAKIKAGDASWPEHLAANGRDDYQGYDQLAKASPPKAGNVHATFAVLFVMRLSAEAKNVQGERDASFLHHTQ
jgi:hypothetical protein